MIKATPQFNTLATKETLEKLIGHEVVSIKIGDGCLHKDDIFIITFSNDTQLSGIDGEYGDNALYIEDN